MKTLKWLAIAFALAVAANIAREAMKADQEVTAKMGLKDSCARVAQAGDAIPPEHIEAVCTCTTNNTQKALGTTKFLRLASVKDATDSDRQAMLAELAACVEEHVPKS